MKDVARRVTTGVVTTALVAHVVLTAFENLPHGKVSLGMRLPVFKKIPQWRFFAPNPGVEDLYLMYRTRAGDGSAWGPWAEIPLLEAPSPLSVVWNPGSRASKALFDTAHQLRTLAGYGSSFEWATTSEGFRLVADVVRRACLAGGARGSFQFMILAAVPGRGRDGLTPIMVSPAQQVVVDDQDDAPAGRGPRRGRSEAAA